MSTKSGIFEMMPNELYVIGDIHGDFYALKQALINTGCVYFDELKTTDIVKPYGKDIRLIDGCDFYDTTKIKWNEEKKNCYIVFAGDLIDRCRNVINNYCSLVVHDEDCDYKILKLLLDLNKKALNYQSKVIIVLGNHEILNLEGKLRYVSRKGLFNVERLSNINTLVKDNKDDLYGIVRIGNYIICHGGINPNFIESSKHYFDNKQEFILYYNIHVRNFLTDRNYVLTQELISNYESPFWDRSNGLNNQALSEIECKKIFEDNILNVSNINKDKLKIIVAHCPQVINSPKMGINITNCGKYEKRIWRVDVAMSRAFDSYVPVVQMNSLLNQLKERLNCTHNSNCVLQKIDLEFLLSFNISRPSSVQLLLITHNIVDSKSIISESIIMGKTSLSYFYEDVFKKNYLLMALYMLLDIESNYNYLYKNEIYSSENSNLINLINDVKKLLQDKIFKNQTHDIYYIR